MTELSVRPVPRPTRLDLASGMVSGHVGTPALPPVDPLAVEPLAALERSVLPALARPPCVVSFSGGLDSSLVLAVAVRVARREGLPLPVPVTWRFADAPGADESAWQDDVIRALGLTGRWRLLPAGDDLDVVGPVAGRLLARHGVLHPCNLHLHLPIVELAPGGSLLTGAGGDQMLAGWRRPPRTVGDRLRRALAPAVRAALPAGRRPAMAAYPWLRPDVAARCLRSRAAEARAEPGRLDQRIRWHLGRRDLALTRAGLTAMAAEHRVTVVNPLLDPGFLAALVAVAGRARDVTRQRLLARIAGDDLPPVVTAARPKATFLEVFLRRPAREFATGWDGSGVDDDLVDPAALRRVWSTWPIPAATTALLQHVWWTTRGSGPGVGRPARTEASTGETQR
ncbi:asparagine synthase-related protein [Micromonospora sp. WMMD882]|uniref:asparagine synthase-related protein n=1 Tax=Micromonospora sp. WMMD882 TaxID=3015151 RepID=UPI00248B3428|nr:asparagine synthase-related protein [Micromonospora sp. WMMD882]WBB82080.1 asparagine synthase-related protein [Micromonospora sp. WMMD882]